MIFGSAGGALQLNLRLSALENQGVVKTISAPKVTTLDNDDRAHQPGRVDSRSARCRRRA